MLTFETCSSLTLRTHISQELLFHELQNLKQLVEESLKAATQQQTDDASDSFAMEQSRNLQSLARAAQRLHVAASSTAGTRRGSSWEVGSEAGGGLTDAQRERIELWEDGEAQRRNSPPVLVQQPKTEDLMALPVLAVTPPARPAHPISQILDAAPGLFWTATTTGHVNGGASSSGLYPTTPTVGSSAIQPSSPNPPRTRWIVPRDIGNLGFDISLDGWHAARPQPLFISPPIQLAADSWCAGAVLGFRSPGVVAIAPGWSGYGARVCRSYMPVSNLLADRRCWRSQTWQVPGFDTDLVVCHSGCPAGAGRQGAAI